MLCKRDLKLFSSQLVPRVVSSKMLQRIFALKKSALIQARTSRWKFRAQGGRGFLTYGETRLQILNPDPGVLVLDYMDSHYEHQCCQWTARRSETPSMTRVAHSNIRAQIDNLLSCTGLFNVGAAETCKLPGWLGPRIALSFACGCSSSCGRTKGCKSAVSIRSWKGVLRRRIPRERQAWIVQLWART